MNRREVLVRPGWIDSERVQSLPAHVQLLFLKMLHVGDGAGRFEADPVLLRAVLYTRSLAKVSVRDVSSWLQQLHQAGLIKLYTHGGKGYGKVLNYGQRDARRKVVHPDEHEDELQFAAPVEAASEPPWLPDEEELVAIPPASQTKGIEGKGRGKPPAPESNSQWIDRLRKLYPEINVETEIAAAIKLKEREGRRLERRWFEEHWLPKASPTVTRAEILQATRQEPTKTEAPAGWQQAIAETNYGPGGCFEAQSWEELPENVKSFVRDRQHQHT